MEICTIMMPQEAYIEGCWCISPGHRFFAALRTTGKTFCFRFFAALRMTGKTFCFRFFATLRMTMRRQKDNDKTEGQ